MQHSYWNKGPHRINLVAVVTFFFVITPSLNAAFFTGLGTVPGQTPDIRAISGDGSVVVGRGETAQAFRWTLMSGAEELGELPGGQFDSVASGVSYDGRVIVGTSRSSRGSEAVLWTAESGLQRLLDPAVGGSAARGVSADGSIIVGRVDAPVIYLDGLPLFQTLDLFLWTQDGGKESLGVPFGIEDSVRRVAIAGDGKVLVGKAGGGFFGGPNVLWRWTRETGFVEFEHLPGDTDGRPTDVTSDGSIIVGWTGSQPFRWTQALGTVPLVEQWDTQRFGGPHVVSTTDDGSTIVGSGFQLGGPFESFIWDEENGVRELREVLATEYGLDDKLQGWGALQVRGISNDGRRIAGTARNPKGNDEVWIAILDRPGDFNRNDVLDVADIDLLSDVVRTQERINPLFDLNGDNNIDDDDRTIWVRDLAETFWGDADLDGEFNSGDLTTVLAAGEFEDDIDGNSGWATGDWNGDGDFTSADLVVALADGGYEQGPRAAVNVVPEPRTLFLLFSGVCMVTACRLSNRRGTRS